MREKEKIHFSLNWLSPAIATNATDDDDYDYDMMMFAFFSNGNMRSINLKVKFRVSLNRMYVNIYILERNEKFTEILNRRKGKTKQKIKKHTGYHVFHWHEIVMKETRYEYYQIKKHIKPRIRIRNSVCIGGVIKRTKIAFRLNYKSNPEIFLFQRYLDRWISLPCRQAWGEFELLINVSEVCDVSVIVAY